MSSQSSPTLILEVHQRRSERRIAIVALFLAALAPSMLFAPVLAALTGVALAGLLSALFLHAGWFGNGLARVVWAADGTWRLYDRAGAESVGELMRDARAGVGFVWLRWRLPAGSSRTLLLLPGDLAAQALRRLVVRLRVDGSAVPSSPQFLDG